MDKLAGRAAVVTGAASGIGRGVALALARRGVGVVVADIDGEGASTVAGQITANGGTAMAQVCDVSEDQAFEVLKAAALQRFGRVDIVVNNVGVLTRGLPEQIPMTEWERIINVNLFSVVRSNLTFLPLLIAQGEGHIVNTASFAGLLTYSYDRLPYAAAKAAIIQISEGLAIYLRPLGVGVTVLCPGPVKTNIMSSVRTFGPPTDVRGPGPQFVLKDAEDVGEQVAAAILANRFMLPTDAQVIEALTRRAQDWDGFLQDQIDNPHIIAPAPKP